MSENTSFSVAVASIAIVFTIFITVWLLSNRKNPPLPPGPRPLPLIGNAHQIPPSEPWFTFQKWGEQYGDLVHVSAFGTSIVILNSAKAAVELLECRGAIYADRPIFPMAGILVGYDSSVPLMAYDKRHRESRKLMNNYLNVREVEALHSSGSMQQMVVDYMLKPLLESPEDFRNHIRRTVAATVLFISHGHKVAMKNDPLVELADRATDNFALACTPGAFLVDIFPLLRYVPEWFPGASFKVKAREWRQTAMELRDQPYKAVKKNIMKGTTSPSCTASLIEDNPNPTDEEEMIYKWVTVAIYSGGADTTVSAISSFFLEMALYPEVQKKAQEELDRVVGLSRLPDFSDRSRLPYIAGVIKEVLRYNPVAPIAIPHRAKEDDVYRGYHIPKGATIIANNWAILHDPTLYPSPSEFLPERYESTDSDVNPDPTDFAFGYGRRVCPGIHLAEASLFIAVVSILATFDISDTLTPNGIPISEVKYTGGVISHPGEFLCRVKPRSHAANLIRLRDV